MTHLTMDQLLALREPGAEPGAVAAQAHLDQCEICRRELERLHQRVARLKALPTLRPSRDRWPVVQARLEREHRRHRLRRVVIGGVGGLAAAASVALAVAVARNEPDVEPPDVVTAAELQRVMQQSQALERTIDAYGPESRVIDGRTDRIAQALEERIAEVDQRLQMLELSERQQREEQLLRLWQERVGLLDALVDVHVTRASNVGL